MRIYVSQCCVILSCATQRFEKPAAAVRILSQNFALEAVHRGRSTLLKRQPACTKSHARCWCLFDAESPYYQSQVPLVAVHVATC